MRTIKITLLYLAAFATSLNSIAQVGIGTTTPSASLDIQISDPNNPENKDGVLIPRLENFPTVDPASAQDGMLVFMNNPAAYAGMGFYFWNNDTATWLPLGDNKWEEGQNGSGDDLIFAVNANNNGNKVVVKDDGFVGIGTDDPVSELHVIGSRAGAGKIELTVENTVSDAELRLIPGGTGSEYTFVANDDATSGLTIYENSDEVIQIKAGGDLRIDQLKSANNVGTSYPAKVYVESDGTLKVQPTSSVLDKLVVNATNFATQQYCETVTPNQTVYTVPVYTYTLTPTEDILLEISYHLSARFSDYNTTNTNIDGRHNTKMYGTLVRLNGVDYTRKSSPFIGNDGLHGIFYPSDQLFIPLVADGTTYTITVHGYVQNDNADGDESPLVGIRGTFGGNVKDRMQILKHK
jgi:hypothetical protein